MSGEQTRQLNHDALRAMQARDPTTASELLRRSLAVDSRQPTVWLNLAATRRALGDLDGAMNALELTLGIEPRNFAALLGRASLLDRPGNERHAGAAYGIALTQAPPDATLDAATLRAVRRARELNTAHVVALDAFIRRWINDAPARSAASSVARTRVDAFIELTLGRRRRYRQEPAEFFYPGLAAIEFHDRGDFPWIEELEAATAAIRAELVEVLQTDAQLLVPYIDYPADVPVDQWAELNHSPRWSAYHLIERGVPAPEAARMCPRTMEAIAALPQPVVDNRSPAAMFSVLRPHTRIPPHTGVANTRLVVHLPVIVPPGCGFRVGGETREWREGQAWVFDDTIEHEAWNDSDRPRTILICDIWNPSLGEDERQLVSAVMAAMDAFNQVEARVRA